MSTLATPLPNPPAQPARPKNWFQRHWVLALIGGCVALMILFAGFIAALFAVVEGSLKSSDACTQALRTGAQQSACSRKIWAAYATWVVHLRKYSGFRTVWECGHIHPDFRAESQGHHLRSRQKISGKMAFRYLGG